MVVASPALTDGPRLAPQTPADSRTWDGDEASKGMDPAPNTAAGAGKAIRVRVSFDDDAGNAESVTSQPTETVDVNPLRATMEAAPAPHDGQSSFTFELRFNEEPKQSLSYKPLSDHASTVTGGAVDAGRGTR